jgi:hypothetical protein
LTRELPFPIIFELPEGWTPVPPDEAGQADAAYVAVRDANTADPVATNIVISGLGLHDATVDVAALGAHDLAHLQSRYAVTVLKRDITTDGPARQAAHLLQIEYAAGHSTTPLRQIRIITAFGGADDPADVAVVRLVMTCPAEVFEAAGPEFGRFLASIAPATSHGEPTSDGGGGDPTSKTAHASSVDRQPGSSGA